MVFGIYHTIEYIINRFLKELVRLFSYNKGRGGILKDLYPLFNLVGPFL